MDPITMGLIGTAASGALTKLFNPGGGYKKAQKVAEKYYNEGQDYLKPYEEQGQQAYQPLNSAMQNLMNPEQMYNQWAENYETSPYARDQMERAQNQGLRTAGSMGWGTSTPALQAIQSGTQQISNADRDNQFKRLMDSYIHGAGIAQNIYGQGANTAGQLANNANTMGQNSADHAYGAASAPGQMFGNLMGAAAGLGGSYMGMQGMNNLANAWSTAGKGGMPGPVQAPMTYGGNYV